MAANLWERKVDGIEPAEEVCKMSRARREERDVTGVKADWKRHITDFKVLKSLGSLNLTDVDDCGGDSVCDNTELKYGLLPFDSK